MISKSEIGAIEEVRHQGPGPKTEAILGLLVIPLGFFIALFWALWRLVRRPRPLPETPRFRAVESGERLRDVADFAARVQAEDTAVRRGFGSMDFQLVYAADLIPSTLDIFPRYANRFFRCPPPFKRIVIESFDGTPIAAEIAARDDRPRPGLVITHGIFGSSGQKIYSDPAIRAFADWGFNVIVIDLRGWSRSVALSDAPITGGWREAEDILAAAKYLLENTKTTTVGGIGYSLGGASMLNAAAHDLAPKYLASGVISESGFSDLRQVLSILDHNPGILTREYIVYWIFRLGFGAKLRVHKFKGGSLHEYLDQVSAPYYGVSPNEIMERSSVIHRVDKIRVPVLQLHAVDDWIVSVRHAYALRQEAARVGNRLVGVCVRSRGAHCAFARVSPKWQQRVVREFFAATSGVDLVPSDALEPRSKSAAAAG